MDVPATSRSPGTCFFGSGRHLAATVEGEKKKKLPPETGGGKKILPAAHGTEKAKGEGNLLSTLFLSPF